MEFLHTRLDEQEARVRAMPKGPWKWRENGLAGEEGWVFHSIGSDARIHCLAGWDAYLQDIQCARVLADIRSKRRLLKLHAHRVVDAPRGSADADRDVDAPRGSAGMGQHYGRQRRRRRRPLSARRSQSGAYGVHCAVCGWAGDDPTSGCETLRILALPYATHANYRHEWRP
ncbi:DUF6221 family protein [Streptomyces lienomycini]|uniref:DUF6221 family protein n=1 Tax=Streptomyces lienomycini TaxID=284035 RepID=A0ABV9WWJ7_9ACTN